MSTWFILLASIGVAGQPTGVPPQAVAPSAPAATTIAVDEAWLRRLEGIDAAMGKVVDLRADFEQRRHTPLLKKPLVSKGVVLTKGERVRWDTATPRASSLVIGGGEIRMYYPADKLVEVYPVGDGFKDLAGAPLPRLSVLRERFDMSPLASKEIGADEGDTKFIAVRLTPKSADLRKHVTAVKVLLDTARGVATKVVMTDPEGEETEILFSNIRLNSGVKDDEVTLTLPGDVRVSRPLGDGKGTKQGDGARPDPKPVTPESKP